MNSTKEIIAVVGTIVLMAAILVGIGFTYDADKDGWSYIKELIQKTDPNNSDTDDDTVIDSEDPDPRDPSIPNIQEPIDIKETACVKTLPPKQYRLLTFDNLAECPVYVSVIGGKNITVVPVGNNKNQFKVSIKDGGFFSKKSIKESVIVDENMMKYLFDNHFRAGSEKNIEVNLKDLSSDNRLIDISLDISQKIRDAGPKVRSTLFDQLRYQLWGDSIDAPTSGDVVNVRLYGTTEYEINKYKFGSYTYNLKSNYYIHDNLLSIKISSVSRPEVSTEKNSNGETVNKKNSNGETVINDLGVLLNEIDRLYIDGFSDRDRLKEMRPVRVVSHIPNVYQQINRIDDSRISSFGSKHYIFLSLGSFAGDRNWSALNSSSYKWLTAQWMFNNLSWERNRSIYVKSDFCTPKDKVTFIGLDYDNDGGYKEVQRKFIQKLFNVCSTDYIYNNN